MTSLIIVLTLVIMAPFKGYSDLPVNALIKMCFLSILFVELLLYFQGRYKIFPLKPSRENVFIQALLIACLGLNLYGLGINRFFFPYQTLCTSISLAFYLGSLWIWNFSNSFFNFSKACSDADNSIRPLVPFVLPLLIYSAIYDLILYSPFHKMAMWPWNLMLIPIFLCFMLWFPLFIYHFWQCHPLPDGPLRIGLIKVCRHAGFYFRELGIWNHSPVRLNAAILGIIPRWRYILFSKELLEQLPPPCLEAILAHEIGHSSHFHLLFYPFLFLGLGYLFLPLFAFSSFWNYDPFFSSFLIFLLTGLYVRFFFGYFSRQFERQADLHLFALQIPVQSLIQAFDIIGCLTGGTHKKPNWHHYSLQERIDFLLHAEKHPQAILKHHQHVKWLITLYLCLIILLTFIVVLVL